MLGLAGNGEEELELRRQLVLSVETIGEVDSSDSAVGMNLDAQGLDIVGTVGTSREIREVELDLVPALVQTHGHGTDEGLHTGRRLIVRCAEPTSNVLIIQHLHLESEVFLKLRMRGGETRVKNLTFLMIMTRKGNLMPRVLLASAGQVM